MELLALSCNNCGGKLKVADDTKFVTCTHCDTQLTVRHEDGAAFTAVTEAATRLEESAAAIEAHAEALGESQEKLFLQGEIERLDREWETRRESLLVRRKDGGSYVPTRTSPALIGLVALFAFVPAVMISMADGESELGVVVWVGSVVFAVGIALAFASLNRQADRYNEALSDHEAERDQLLEQLRQM